MTTNKGYIHVYTGNGKGKTTAAFGLAIRALCAGKTVYIGQFVKDMKYHETKIDQCFPKVTIEQLGKGCFISEMPTEKDQIEAQKGLSHCANIMHNGKTQVIILDELTIALYYHLLTPKEVRQALEQRDPTTEIIITGRYAPAWLIEQADLVTEMREIKHYYQQGVLSREGIDK